jgi:WD40 repeat protein
MSNPLELEHVIGYTGSYVHSLVVHPRNKELILFPIGAVLVISDIKDTHNQEFLRRHDEAITTLSVSTSGKYIATAQKGSTKKKGNIATIVVWDFERKKIIHEIEGHVNKVLSLCFTHDDKFLCSTGRCVFVC